MIPIKDRYQMISASQFVASNGRGTLAQTTQAGPVPSRCWGCLGCLLGAKFEIFFQTWNHHLKGLKAFWPKFVVRESDFCHLLGIGWKVVKHPSFRQRGLWQSCWRICPMFETGFLLTLGTSPSGSIKMPSM